MGACDVVADVVLILDESTSIAYVGYDNWYVHIIGFAKMLANFFVIGETKTRVSVMTFSEGTRVAFLLNRHYNSAAMQEAIGSLDIYGGQTNIAAALRRARTELLAEANGARPGVKKTCVLLTDGEPNRETNSTLSEADALKAVCDVYTVGITQQVNNALLMSIASPPSSTHFYFVENYRNINDIVRGITSNICSFINGGP